MEALHKSYREYQRGTAAPKRAPRPTQPERQRRRAPAPKSYRKVQISYKMHPLMLAKRDRAVHFCVTVAIIFVMLVAVVAGNAISAKINLENLSIQTNIDNLEKQIDKLNLSISTECDIQKVAQVAENELSMGFPDDAQVYYIEFEEQQDAQQQAAEPESNIFQRIQEWILEIVG